MKNTETVIRNVLHEQCGVSTNAVRLQAHLGRDLGLDSLDVAELMICLEKELCISIPSSDWHALETIQELIDYVEHKINDMPAYA